MSFLSSLFGRRNSGKNDAGEIETAKKAPIADAETAAQIMANAPDPQPENRINIWDLDTDAKPASGESDVQVPDMAMLDRVASRAGTAGKAPSGGGKTNRRNRTRLIGFDSSQGDVVDLFSEEQKNKPAEKSLFPVGWLLVIDGPGRGHSFSLVSGMSPIGRGEDQAVQLDYGDTAISRSNHAAIVFDPSEKKFILGHGGKVNIVRLNGRPVISNEDLVDGDRIALGETVLQLKTLVGPDFDWDSVGGDEESDDDVAIA